MSKVITPELLSKALSYAEYREHIGILLEVGQTTGLEQSESLFEYSKLNVHRMDRLDKTIEISPEVKEKIATVERRQIWFVLTEAWCGDAAQNIPVLNEIASQSDKIDFKLILRDENSQVMDAYLTNGSKSIPKLIAVDANTYEELFTWGPRPKHAQDMVMDFKANPNGVAYADFVKEVQVWYNHDKGQTLQNEIVTLVENKILA